MAKKLSKIKSVFKNGHKLFFRSNGRIFHSVGAATEKDLAPYVLKLK